MTAAAAMLECDSRTIQSLDLACTDDAERLVQMRWEAEGKCIDCGTRTHEFVMKRRHPWSFRKRIRRVPLTVEGECKGGRCLVCDPTTEAEKGGKGGGGRHGLIEITETPVMVVDAPLDEVESVCQFMGSISGTDSYAGSFAPGGEVSVIGGISICAESIFNVPISISVPDAPAPPSPASSSPGHRHRRSDSVPLVIGTTGESVSGFKNVEMPAATRNVSPWGAPWGESSVFGGSSSAASRASRGEFGKADFNSSAPGGFSSAPSWASAAMMPSVRDEDEDGERRGRGGPPSPVPTSPCSSDNSSPSSDEEGEESSPPLAMPPVPAAAASASTPPVSTAANASSESEASPPAPATPPPTRRNLSSSNPGHSRGRSFSNSLGFGRVFGFGRNGRNGRDGSLSRTKAGISPPPANRLFSESTEEDQEQEQDHPSSSPPGTTPPKPTPTAGPTPRSHIYAVIQRGPMVAGMPRFKTYDEIDNGSLDEDSRLVTGRSDVYDVVPNLSSHSELVDPPSHIDIEGPEPSHDLSGWSPDGRKLRYDKSAAAAQLSLPPPRASPQSARPRRSSKRPQQQQRHAPPKVQALEPTSPAVVPTSSPGASAAGGGAGPDGAACCGGNVEIDAEITGLSISRTERQAHRHLVRLRTLSVQYQNRVEIGRAGGVPAVISSMKRFGNRSAPVAKQACAALQNLASVESNATSVALHGGSDALVRVMELHPRDAGVQEMGCAALRNLVAGRSRDNRTAVGKSGGVRAVVGAMRLHPLSVKICDKGVACLGNLCIRHHENRKAVGREGGVSAILEAMRYHSGHEGVCEKGMCTLAELIGHPLNLELLKSEEGVGKFILDIGERFPRQCKKKAMAIYLKL